MLLFWCRLALRQNMSRLEDCIYKTQQFFMQSWSEDNLHQKENSQQDISLKVVFFAVDWLVYLQSCLRTYFVLA